MLDLVPWRQSCRELPNYQAIRSMLRENPHLTNTDIALEIGCSITPQFCASGDE